MAEYKYRALDARQTGLPWTTGVVATAKCNACNKKAAKLFRRCATCAHIRCIDCFDKGGFKHGCLEGTVCGPFPTYAQEAAVLSVFDAAIPDKKHPEREEHDGNWTWNPPTALQNQHNGIALDANNQITGLNRATPQAPSISPISVAAEPSTPRRRAAAASPGTSGLPPIGSFGPGSSAQMTPKSAAGAKTPAASPSKVTFADLAAASKGKKKAPARKSAATAPKALTTKEKPGKLWQGASSTRKSKPVITDDEDEDVDMEDAEGDQDEIPEHDEYEEPEDYEDEVVEDEPEEEGDVDYHDAAQQVEADGKLAKKIAKGTPQTLAATRARRETKRKASSSSNKDNEGAEAAPRPPPAKKVKKETAIQRKQRELLEKRNAEAEEMTRRYNDMLNVNASMDVREQFSEKSGIRGERELVIDVSKINKLKIKLYPGMQARDPLVPANGAITSTGVPVSAPIQLFYQWNNTTSDRVQRDTVAVLEPIHQNDKGEDIEVEEDKKLKVPRTELLASTLSYGGPGATIDVMNVLTRAMTGDELAGDTSSFSTTIPEDESNKKQWPPKK